MTLGRVTVGRTQGHRVVWGGYGYGNTGDDLVLAVALADLRKNSGSNITVLSPAPEQTRIGILGTEIILHPSGGPRRAFEKWFWRWADYVEAGGMKTLADSLYRLALKHPEKITREAAWLKALASASVLHLTGGGYLTDQFDLRHFLRPLRLARSRHLPVTTSPLGLGPFQSPRKAAAVVAALRGSKLLVRDPDSLQFCTTQGLTATERPDDGFRWPQIIDVPSPQSDGKGSNLIGVCLFSQHSALWSDTVEVWWETCLRALTFTLPDCRFEGFCFHTGRDMDYETTRRLFARAGLNPDNVRSPQPDFRTAILDLSRYEMIISTRFHAVVAASALQIPSVAMVLDDYYENKMRGALKYSSAPVSLVNPLHCPPQIAVDWLVQQNTSHRQRPPTLRPAN